MKIYDQPKPVVTRGVRFYRSPPADKPLGEPSKKFEDTFSAEEVIMSAFFPGAETKAQ